MNRVETHIISKSHELYNIVDDWCFRSKNLYNYANYIIRQEFINNRKWIRYNEMDKLAKGECYNNLLAQTSQQILKLLDKNWKSFFDALKSYKRSPSKFSGRPKLPKYKKKDGRNIIIFTNQQCKLKEGFITFPKRFTEFKLKTNVNNLVQVRIIPQCGCYKLEVVYDFPQTKINLDSSKYCSIDLGINNLATLTNNFGDIPIVINGRPLKSINQFYNYKLANAKSELKVKNKLEFSNRTKRLTSKRNNKVKDYLHKASRIIIDYLAINEVETLVVGYNENWKVECDMGKRNNQNFVQIPFLTFVSMLEYKAENLGIKVVRTEESYTSGTSFLDLEEPSKYFYNKNRRIKRGLFKSNNGILINSDVNGSYQIMKKVVPNAFADGIEGVVLHPVKINF